MAERIYVDHIDNPIEKHDEFDIEILQNLETIDSIVNDLVIIDKDDPSLNEPQNTQLPSDSKHHHELTSQNLDYNRSMSTHHGNREQRPLTIQRSESVPGDSHNKELLFNSTERKHSERRKFEHNDHYPIFRLLEPTCEGIRERIELLGELLISEPPDSIPDVYDEMAHIITATERNERLQAGPDGKRLLELTTAARSNLNIDLHNLDDEIQRQFGLYSVEVTGDGACAFRAILISGMQQADLFHSELRDKAINQVRLDTPYYSTVLRPGDVVTKKELDDWIQAMNDPYTYGDEMANIAVADAYHVQLVIFRAGELLTVVNPRDGLVHQTAFLVNVGTHYKALVPKHELDQARRNSERLYK